MKTLIENRQSPLSTDVEGWGGVIAQGRLASSRFQPMIAALQCPGSGPIGQNA